MFEGINNNPLYTMKKIIMMLAIVLAGKLVQAQSVDDGKKALYYGRYTTAKNAFTNAVNAKPKDADAIYWLGQTYLKMDDVKAAKEVYEKAAQAGVTDPLLTVGSGHIDLLEGKKDQAMQKFEQAIASSKTRKGENPEILNAVGRANADGPSTAGNPAYAVEKLKRAAELNANDPDIFINLGINYLKLGSEHGGDAYEAFNNALKLNPTYAMAKYRLGKIFLTQGNKEKFESYFIGATESDPQFAPAYLDLYNYYAERDVNKAKEYLEKYVANTDKDCNVDFFYADYLFRAGKYQESLDKAKAMENGACKDYPRLKVLYAYNYDRLGDSAQAKSNIESFLTTADSTHIQPGDYILAANVLKRIKGSEQSAIKYLQVAIKNDTARKNQFVYMDTIASLYRKMGDVNQRLVWLQKSFATNPSPSNLDIYNLGDAAANAGNYQIADSMFTIYKTKYPDQVYSYAGLAKSAIAKDKDTTAGSAVQAVMDYIGFLEKTDKVRYKAMIVQNYGYLVYVHANVKKDYPAALKDLEGILAVDPENSYAKATAAQLKKVIDANNKTGKSTGATKTTAGKEPSVK
jgi:tetratricopeptide (TPR) repeat protein